MIIILIENLTALKCNDIYFVFCVMSRKRFLSCAQNYAIRRAMMRVQNVRCTRPPVHKLHVQFSVFSSNNS